MTYNSNARTTTAAYTWRTYTYIEVLTFPPLWCRLVKWLRISNNFRKFIAIAMLATPILMPEMCCTPKSPLARQFCWRAYGREIAVIFRGVLMGKCTSSVFVGLNMRFEFLCTRMLSIYSGQCPAYSIVVACQTQSLQFHWYWIVTWYCDTVVPCRSSKCPL